MLAITGVILNHTEYFKLTSRFIHNQHILKWYGIPPPTANHVFNSSEHYLSQFGKQLYLNKTFLLKTHDSLQGMIETPNFIAIALKYSIILLSIDGEVIETIEQSDLQKIGTNSQGHIFVQQSAQTLISTDGLLSWQTSSIKAIQWSQKTYLPAPLKKTIQQRVQSNTLPLERVFLDLHSGRFFGNIGVLIVDICGVLLILLVFSGVSLWVKHMRFHRRQK
jgi:hypothetical protein